MQDLFCNDTEVHLRLQRFEANGKISMLKSGRRSTSSSTPLQQPQSQPAAIPPPQECVAYESAPEDSMAPCALQSAQADFCAEEDDAQIARGVPSAEATTEGGEHPQEVPHPLEEPAPERGEGLDASLELLMTGGPDSPLDTPAFCLGPQEVAPYHPTIDAPLNPGAHPLSGISPMPAPRFSTLPSTVPALGPEVNPPDSSDATQLPESQEADPSHNAAPLVQTQYGSQAVPSLHMSATECRAANEPTLHRETAPMADTQQRPPTAAPLSEVFSVTQSLGEQSLHIESGPHGALPPPQHAGTSAHARPPTCATQYGGDTHDLPGVSPMDDASPADVPRREDKPAGEQAEGGGGKRVGSRKGYEMLEDGGISAAPAVGELLSAGVSQGMFATRSSSQALRQVSNTSDPTPHPLEL